MWSRSSVHRAVIAHGLSKRLLSTSCSRLKVLPEVQAAISDGAPVVALESTIISHGMPFPNNLQMAREIEAIVREGGAVPATIAVINGQLCVGLNDDELTLLAQEGPSIMKCSTRDLPVVLAKSTHGATTVAATMNIAARAGVSVFVTGGIGGVHRGAEDTMDVSADLTELGRTPVAVVCAGAKSILDIPKTLEYLETMGVPVATFQTNEFPAFFTRKSGCMSPHRFDTERELASLVHATHDVMQLQRGLVFGVPIPENSSADAALVEEAIQQTLKEANQQNVAGKEMTPFILKRVNEMTSGKSLASNIELVQNNARVGSKIAVELANLRRSRTESKRGSLTDAMSQSHAPSTPPQQRLNADVLLIGGSTVDLTGQPLPPHKLHHGHSTPGVLHSSAGGVGRNVAEAFGRLAFNGDSSARAVFASAVGTDSHAEAVRRSLDNSRTSMIEIPHDGMLPTPTYTCLLDGDGDVHGAIADMRLLDEIRSEAIISTLDNVALQSRGAVVLDANFPSLAIPDVLRYSQERWNVGRERVWFEPTSPAKAIRAVRDEWIESVGVLTPNAGELLVLCEAVGLPTFDVDEMEVLIHGSPTDGETAISIIKDKSDAFRRATGTHALIVKLGACGVVVTNAEGTLHVPSQRVESVESATGAGDCLLGGVLYGTYVRGLDIASAVQQCGIPSAVQSLACSLPVPKTLSV